MLEKKLEYIDALRVLACYLVILNHSDLAAQTPSDGIYLIIVSLVSSPSSELFLTISGSLLLPTFLKMKNFYKKRFSRLVFPVLFWSCFILLFNLFKGAVSTAEALDQFLLMPFKPVTPAYWFIYVISGLYLIAPIISPWLLDASKKEFQFVLGLWLFTMILPYFNILFPDFYVIEGNYYFILNNFGGFLGYMLLGVYLRKYPIIFKNKIHLCLMLGTLLSFAFIPLLFIYFYDKSFYGIFYKNNLSFYSVICVFMIFIFMQNISFNTRLYELLNKIAHYSFGIYLMHIIIVRDVVWLMFQESRLLHPLIETPLIALLSLIICFFIVKLFTFLPKSKFLVGA